jgi:hypothetical protein
MATHNGKVITATVQQGTATNTSGSKYEVITKGGTKTTLTVRVVNAPARITLKASGTANIINPESAVTVTPKFANFNYTAGGEVTVNNPAFVIDGEPTAAGAVRLRLAETASGLKSTDPQNVTLTYTDANGNTATSDPVRISPKQLRPKLAQSAKTVSLQGNDVYSEAVIGIAAASPMAAQIDRVEVEKKYEGLYKTRKVENGRWAIGFVPTSGGTVGDVRKGASVKLNVYLKGSDKPVTVSVKVVVM